MYLVLIDGVSFQSRIMFFVRIGILSEPGFGGIKGLMGTNRICHPEERRIYS
jgi:hypothetical protein